MESNSWSSYESLIHMPHISNAPNSASLIPMVQSFPPICFSSLPMSTGIWVCSCVYVCVCTLLLHLVSMLQKPRHGGNPSGTSSFLISLALHAPPWDMSSWSPAISSVPSMSQTLAPLHLSHLIIKIGLWCTEYVSNIQLNSLRLGVQKTHSWGVVISRFRLKSHWFQSTKVFLYIMPSGIDKGLRV